MIWDLESGGEMIEDFRKKGSWGDTKSEKWASLTFSLD